MYIPLNEASEYSNGNYVSTSEILYS